MGGLREGLQRVRSFFKKEQRDADLDAEVTAHLDLAVEENIRHGMSPEEARRRALIQFGGVAQAKEQQREARGLPGSKYCCRMCVSRFAVCAATGDSR